MESFPSSDEGGKELDRLTTGEKSERKHPRYVHRVSPTGPREVQRAETDNEEYNKLWNWYNRLDKSKLDNSNVVQGEVVSDPTDELATIEKRPLPSQRPIIKGGNKWFDEQWARHEDRTIQGEIVSSSLDEQDTNE